MRRWTIYCNELYNYPIQTNEELIKDTITFIHDISLPILKSEVRNAINTLKNGKAPGIDNIPDELIKCGGVKILDSMTSKFQQIWKKKEWPA